MIRALPGLGDGHRNCPKGPFLAKVTRVQSIDPKRHFRATLCFQRGTAAADLQVTTTFLLFFTLLKSKIYDKEVHPHIILSIYVQSVLILLCCLDQAYGTVAL